MEMTKELEELAKTMTEKGDAASMGSDGFVVLTTSRERFRKFRVVAMKAGWDWDFCKAVVVGRRMGTMCKFVARRQLV